MKRRAVQWQKRLDQDPRLLRTFAAPPLRGRRLPRGVRIILYERLPDGPSARRSAAATQVRDG